jgi:uncharacterized linocin/CFP29 family protein
MADNNAALIQTPAQFANSGASMAASFIANGFKPDGLRTNAVLRHEEWLELDAALVNVALPRLRIVEDLRAAGLVHNLGGLGTIMSGYEKASDISAADVSMDGLAQSENDTIDFSEVQIPVPITHKDYRINLRKLMASRALGESIDTMTLRAATRQVAEQLEDMVFNGVSSINVNGQTIYGLTNEPNANTLSGSDWGTIGNIYSDCMNAVAALEADNFFGPYDMYVATTQFGQMRAIYSDGSRESAYERVLRGIPQIRSIRVSDSLTAGTAVMFEMRSDVIDLAIAQDIVHIEWETKGGWVMWNKVYAVMVPRVKSDYDGRSGILNISGI